MKYADHITPEFDETRRILHWTADEKLRISNRTELNTAFECMREVLNKYASSDNRCYIVVDMNKFIIDPGLSEAYSIEARSIHNEYAYPGGIFRYGYEISRVTVKMAQQSDMIPAPNICVTKAEAYNRINKMIEESTGKDSKDSIDDPPQGQKNKYGSRGFVRKLAYSGFYSPEKPDQT